MHMHVRRMMQAEMSDAEEESSAEKPEEDRTATNTCGTGIKC